MAGRRKLLDLKNICLNSIYIHTVRYWNLINITKENKKLNFLSPKYKVGSCEYLSDDYVYFLLKKLYKYYKLNSAILLGFLHRNLRTIDFSFITSRNAVNSDVCQFIRNISDNITQLNLSEQGQLKPLDLCEIVEKMDKLVSLNLANTQANYQVVQMVALTCRKLRFLNLKGCHQIFEECIEKLASDLGATLEHLNIESTIISEMATKNILLRCKRMRFLNTQNLLPVILQLFNNGDDCEYSLLDLDRIEIDLQTNFRCEMMDALEFLCPKIRTLTARNLSNLYSIEYLDRFEYLSELSLSNNLCMISRKFNDLIKVLKGPLGSKLRSLQLSYFPDVNLKSISLHCRNLKRLTIEMIGNYEPAEDNNLDMNNDEILAHRNNKHLEYFSIRNMCSRQIQSNEDLLRGHLLDLCGDQIRFLEFNGLNEINDHFLSRLFYSDKFIDEGDAILLPKNMKLLKLIHLNNLKLEFLDYLLLCTNNLPFSVDIKGCTNIPYKYICRFNKIINDIF